MSLHLLVPKAIAGQVEHMYYHDAESFIWVLTWICLRYDKGELLRRNRPLDDEWLTVDARGCHKEKMSYLGTVDIIPPTPSHEGNLKHAAPFSSVPKDDDVVFDMWLQNHVPQNVLQSNFS
ncbi:hypothetical protein BD769DRAFT_1508385, partial [Suillus cothurnatus]